MTAAVLPRYASERYKEPRAPQNLYPIAGRTTIANAQTKQVSFLDVAGVAARKLYGRTIEWMQNDTAPVNVASQIAFSTSRLARSVSSSLLIFASRRP